MSEQAKPARPLVPSLDAIADDPASVRDLPSGERAALIARCAAVLSTLAAEQIRQGANCASAPSVAAQSMPDDADRLLDVIEAARLLAVPKAWLYRNGRELGLAVKLKDATLRFSYKALQNYIRAHQPSG